jgi:hypothetical protein
MAAPKSLSALKRKQEAIQQAGYLQDCWIESYCPRGTARGDHRYGQLRSRKPFANGKRRRHLKAEEISLFRQLIENGRMFRRIEQEIAILEGRKARARVVLASSASDEWYTPPEYIELARLVMGGIDLDPASNETAQNWIQASSYYTQPENGLNKIWRGRLWLNPPYGTQVQLWTQQAIREYQNGSITSALLLVRPAPGSAWYQQLSALFPCCIPHKRIKFINASGKAQKSPVHGNAFFYLGNDMERFREVFSAIGVVTKPC